MMVDEMIDVMNERRGRNGKPENPTWTMEGMLLSVVS
jgi:hypothetical protein